jgi:hypothetical protein
MKADASIAVRNYIGATTIANRGEGPRGTVVEVSAVPSVAVDAD